MGYNANALHLYSIGQPMTTGYPIIHCAKKQFRPEKPYFAGECADWLNCLSHSQGTKIQHGLTTGERRIGKYKVDRYCEATKTNYEFHGCWWHMHGCIDWNKYDDRKHPQRGTTIPQVVECDQQRRQWFEGKGYNVVAMHGCQRKTRVSGNPTIQNFVQKRHHPREKYGRLNEGQLINMIKRGVLFGFVECEMKVPDHLQSHFEEMMLIFKNTEVQLEDIGEFMEKFAHHYKICPAPRRLSIGSYFGEKICLAIPLVKWYLEHGLIITKIDKVVKYTPVAAFKDFSVDVANASLQGDSDQRYALIAQLMKLIRNSSHGRTIMDKTKHHDLCFIMTYALLMNTKSEQKSWTPVSTIY